MPDDSEPTRGRVVKLKRARTCTRCKATTPPRRCELGFPVRSTMSNDTIPLERCPKPLTNAKLVAAPKRWELDEEDRT